MILSTPQNIKGRRLGLGETIPISSDGGMAVVLT